MQPPQLSVVSNLLRFGSHGRFFRNSFRNPFAAFGMRVLHAVQKHFRKLSRPELILQAISTLKSKLHCFSLFQLCLNEAVDAYSVTP